MATQLERELLDDLVARTPWQPATAYWRSIELAVVLGQTYPAGLGLDVGCGDGTVLQVLRAHGLEARFVGLDVDPEETALADARGVYERVVTASIHEIPEADATFDFAFSNSVLEHIPDLAPGLREVARTLRPGAPFVLTVPTQLFNDSLKGTIALSPLLGRERDTYLRRIDERLLHVNIWPVERWRDELGAAGFDVVDEVPYLSIEQARRWERLANWTGGVAYGLTGRKRRLVDVSRSLKISTDAPGGKVLAPITTRVARSASRRSASSPPAPTDGCRLFVARRTSG